MMVMHLQVNEIDVVHVVQMVMVMRVGGQVIGISWIHDDVMCAMLLMLLLSLKLKLLLVEKKGKVLVVTAIHIARVAGAVIVGISK